MEIKGQHEDEEDSWVSVKLETQQDLQYLQNLASDKKWGDLIKSVLKFHDEKAVVEEKVCIPENMSNGRSGSKKRGKHKD